MHPVPHAVGLQRTTHFPDDFFVRGNDRKRQRLRRCFQPVEMFGKAKDAALVQAKPFPYEIPALYRTVERAHARPVPGRQRAVDIDKDIPVALVEGLEHIRR